MTSDSVNASAISALMDRESTSRSEENQWDIVVWATEHLIEPIVSAHGRKTVLEQLVGAKCDPYIAALLVQLSGDDSFRVNEIFSDEEIVEAALVYLLAMPNAALRDGQWAWTALWNGWDQFQPRDHYRILLELIDRAPWDDDILWMIGDGPLSHVATDAALRREIDERARDDPKVARARELSAEGEEYTSQS